MYKGMDTYNALLPLSINALARLRNLIMLFASTRFFYLRLFSVIIFVLDRWFTLLPLRFIIVFIPKILAAHTIYRN